MTRDVGPNRVMLIPTRVRAADGADVDVEQNDGDRSRRRGPTDEVDGLVDGSVDGSVDGLTRRLVTAAPLHPSGTYRRRVHIEHTALIVENYDDAIRFFVDALGFDLVEDSPTTTNDGRPKRWVVVRPPEAQTGLLLAQADGERQINAVGRQYAGRVGSFLRVDDFEAARRRMLAHGVRFVTDPRDEPYGRCAVFLDCSGNRWDLLGPAATLDRERP